MCFFLFIALAIARGLPAKASPVPCVEIEQSTKDLTSETLHLLEKLKTDVGNNTVKIVSSSNRFINYKRKKLIMYSCT